MSRPSSFIPRRRSTGRRDRRSLPILVAITALVVGLTTAVASASHGNAELPGSTFEIDDDANLRQDDAGEGLVDWANLAHPDRPEIRATDLATGQDDNSYKGGVKEDTECPNETTGSIPNNKSDLLTLHVYEEPGDPGFLNLAWSRVSEPSGTTLMDFEFNQSTTPCPQGPNVIRTPGDLLLEYAIEQGGARAEISAVSGPEPSRAPRSTSTTPPTVTVGRAPLAPSTAQRFWMASPTASDPSRPARSARHRSTWT